MKKHDIEKNGKISFDEFKLMMTGILDMEDTLGGKGPPKADVPKRWNSQK
jgi:hypothetical protein